MWTVVELDEVSATAEALPPDLLAALAELRVALEVSPTTVGRPYNAGNPAGGMRIVSVGPGKRLTVVFGLIPRERTVTLLLLSPLPDISD